MSLNDQQIKYVDEFRDPAQAKTLLSNIEALVSSLMQDRDRPLQIMEICGGHTHAIFKYGLHELLPPGIEFVHGPGCPVCVLPMGRVDDCLALAHRPEVILTTYGDAMRVPGSKGSLLKARASGADVRMVYSPTDALALARANPDREVVFFALGFETTMPATAMTLIQAKKEGIDNFSVFCNHITIISTMRAILDSPGMQLDGFLGPGHVSMVIGSRVFDFVPQEYGLPFVVSGFEPLDVLQSLWMVLQQLSTQEVRVENQYSRIVAEDGNPAAIQALFEVFELREFFEWRGLGSIEHSGVRLTKKYVDFDAEQRFAVPNLRVQDPAACQCGDVLKGMIKPPQCQVFGKSCTPETPMGALMVSSEGACAAHYQYGSDRILQKAVS